MKYRDFAHLDVLPASWTDAIQEFASSTPNFRITAANATTIRGVAGASAAQAGLAVNGLWRWRTANHDVAHVAGGAGQYDIYAIASANSFTNTPSVDTDLTDYNWYLVSRVAGSPPTGNTPAGNPITQTMKVGETDWDGAAITAIRTTLGAHFSAAPIMPTAPHAAYTPLKVRGFAAQTANLFQIEDSAALDLVHVAPGGIVYARGGLQIGDDSGAVNMHLKSESNGVVNVLQLGVDGSGVLKDQHITSADQTGTGVAASITLNPGASAGLNQAGGVLRLSSGISTGNSGSGSVTVMTSTAGASGSGQNIQSDSWYFWGADLLKALTPAADNAQDIGYPALRVRSMLLGTSLQVGAIPASTGVVRLPNAGQIAFRNAGDTADINALTVSAGGLIGLGSAFTVHPTTGAAVAGGQNVVVTNDTRLGLSALSAVQVRDVGEANQIRAGRVLTNADFTNMGLSAPLGLWNLSDLTDASGNGRSFTNKGTVTFGAGITGAATEAAIFTGSTAQALYINSAAWQQIATGTWGCWFRTAKRGVAQVLLSKLAGGGLHSFQIYVTSSNVLSASISLDGTTDVVATGMVDVADDRWHFAAATYDGAKIRIFLDGSQDPGGGAASTGGPIFAGTAPLNIGGQAADAGTNAASPHFGRVDEAFLTGDVLSEDQLRNLYCARIPHALGVTPTRAACSVRRRRRGGPLATTDFPSQPVRLHNFTAGVLTDQGSGNVSLAAVGGGTISDVAGVDGATQGAKNFAGAHTGLGATDTGLPSGTASRSHGCWMKTTQTPGGALAVMAWGSSGTTADALFLGTLGVIRSDSGTDTFSGPFVADGQWHHVVTVCDNAPADGVKRKLYLDGKLVGGSTVLNSITLAGANKFRVGAYVDGTLPFLGQIDGAFVHSIALTPEQVRTLYNVGSQAMAASPKAVEDHIEVYESTTGILATFDTIEGTDQIDLRVAA